ncbi:hypothetical protein [Mitsuokella multacida]|uniref:hypothetical protein n=1 Tax=Mitsuokella multacida TaxID=52226 RepID=UPI0039F5DABC
MRDLFFRLQRFGAPADAAAGDGDTPAQGGTQDQQDTDTGASTSQPAQTTILGTSQVGEQTQEQSGGSQGNTETKAGAEPPATYDFSGVVPEGLEYDAERAGQFGALARECGLSQEQASKLASYGMQYMQAGQQAVADGIRQTMDGWAQEARQQLGGQFDDVTAKAAVGLNAAEHKIPGLRQMMNLTGAGNRVEMIQLMAEFGKLVGEDPGHMGEGAHEKTLYPNTDFSRY